MYLLYFWHGILKIKYGHMEMGNFIPDEKGYPYYTDIPKKPLTVEHGKIWCKDVEDIPYATSILLDHRERYVKNMQDIWGKDFGFEEDKVNAYLSSIRKDEKTMAAKKTEEKRENIIGASVTLSIEELKFIKSMIRQKIIACESRKSDNYKGYINYSTAAKNNIDNDLKMCYEIYDKLLEMGIREG